MLDVFIMVPETSSFWLLAFHFLDLPQLLPHHIFSSFIKIYH